MKTRQASSAIFLQSQSCAARRVIQPSGQGLCIIEYYIDGTQSKSMVYEVSICVRVRSCLCLSMSKAIAKSAPPRPLPSISMQEEGYTRKAGCALFIAGI